jgi:hypothetical protein
MKGKKNEECMFFFFIQDTRMERNKLKKKPCKKIGMIL